MNTIAEKHSLKVLFKVHGKLALIHTLLQMGMIIKTDPKLEYACAYFDNTQDFNEFKSMVDSLA